MLKRHQVLINDWLAEYIRHCGEKYDVSFSEVIRLTLCVEIGRNIAKHHPKYKFGISEKEIEKMCLPNSKKKDIDLDERHRFISKVYFEARKAIEFALKQEK